MDSDFAGIFHGDSNFTGVCAPKMAEKKVEKKIISNQAHETKLFPNVTASQWPIIYGEEYNIGFYGLEKLHPFDSAKWGKVYQFLKEANMITDETTVRPVEATEEDLVVVHTRNYINSLKASSNVARITEVPLVFCLPNSVVQYRVLRPFRFQTGGTIHAAKLAMERGWAINIGGGFHHCSAQKGGGFCAYADISLAIKFMFLLNPDITKAMIVDLDAHQGNGHERDFMNDENVYIMDVYNRNIYPHDGYAKRAIRRKVELDHFTVDKNYLEIVEENLREALEEFTPDFLVYNAGTDVLVGDPLGNLSISPEGIIERDQLVFTMARERKIPILMVTSGGYQKSTSRIIADSILNLRKLKLIECEGAEKLPIKEESDGIPRSQSEVSFFTRLKNACTGRSYLQGNGSSLTGEKNISKSISDLNKDTDEDFFFKDIPSSKSCSDLTFKDESDLDITSVLDARFGHFDTNTFKVSKSGSGVFQVTEKSSEQFHDKENTN